MEMLLRPLTGTLLMGCVLAAPAATAAQGDWLVRIGLSHVAPQVDSDPTALGANTGVDVDSDTRPSFTIAYMFAEHWAVELLGALPFEHDIEAAGTISGLGTIGRTKHLPPVLSLQYHFQPGRRIRPYAGLGVNYTHFFDTKAQGALAGTSLELDDSWGLAAQLGLDFDVANGWFGNVDVRYVDIDTQASNPAAGTFDVELDPWVFTLSVGRVF